MARFFFNMARSLFDTFLRRTHPLTMITIERPRIAMQPN